MFKKDKNWTKNLKQDLKDRFLTDQAKKKRDESFEEFLEGLECLDDIKEDLQDLNDEVK